MIGEKSNSEILAELDTMVYGHEKAKKLLITLVNRSKMAYRRKYIHMDDTPMDKMNLMLMGASGTGKTYMLECLQKIIHFPLVKVDASRINPEANQNFSVKNIKKSIRHLAMKLTSEENNPYHSVQGTMDQTIVFMDEMDKMGINYGKDEGWNHRTQGELLTLIEDQEEFKQVSFVFAGAFTTLRRETKSTEIGFGSRNVGEILTLDEISDTDLIEYGLTTELLGRITAIGELEVLDADKMYKILNNLILPKKLDDLTHFLPNPENIVTETMKEDIVRQAIDSGQGVRHMKRQVNDIFLDVEFNYEDMQEETKQLPIIHESNK